MNEASDEKEIENHILIRILCSRYLFGGSTEANYLAWTKQQSIQAQSVTLPDRITKAFWIGNSSAETVVLYIHGELFLMPVMQYQN